MSEKKVVAGLSLRADQFKQELAEVRQLEQQAADGGEAFALSFSDGFTRIEGAMHKASATLSSNGEVSKKTFNETIQLLGKLEAAAEAGGKSIEDAPEAIRQAFEIANQQITAVSAQMQVNAVNSAAMRTRFMEAGAQAANLSTQLAAVADQEKRTADNALEVNEKFADIPERIEEIRKAGEKTFDEQVEDLEDLAKELKVAEKAYKKMGDEGAQALAALRPKADAVAAAIAEMAAKAVSSTGRIDDAVKRTDRGFADLAKQISTNPKEAAEALPKVAGFVVTLRNEIEKARAAGGPVTAEAIANLKRFEEQLSRSKVEVGNLKREIDKQVAGVADARQAWQGLDGVISDVAGRFGKVGTAAIGGFAAFKEGYGVGKEIAASIGTDFSAMEQSIEKFIEKAKKVNPAMLDWLTGAGSFEAVRASIQLTKAQYEGYTSAVLAGVEGIDDLKAHTEQFGEIARAHNVILGEGTEGMKLASQAKREGAGDLDQYVRSLGLASEAAKVHNQLVKVGSEGERLWNEIREKGKTSLSDMVKAIKDAQPVIDAFLTKTKEEINAERELQDALNNTTKLRVQALQFEKEQAELVAQQEKVEDGLTASIRNKLAEITASMVVKEGREIPLTKLQISQLQVLLAQNLSLTETEKKKIQAWIDQLSAVEKLRQGERELLAQRIQYELLVNRTVVADAEHAAVVDTKTRTIRNAAGATDDLVTATKSHNKTVAEGTGLNIRWSDKADQSRVSAETSAEAMQKLAGTQASSATEVDRAATAVNKLGTELPKVTVGATQAAEPTQKLGDNAAAAAPELEKVIDSIAKLGVSPETVTGVENLAAAMAALVGHVRALVAMKDDATTALDALGQAAERAAGEGDVEEVA